MTRNFLLYSVLKWISDVCSIYRTYANPVSVQFSSFQHTSTQQTLVVSVLSAVSVTRFTACQTGPVGVSNSACIHT